MEAVPASILVRSVIVRDSSVSAMGNDRNRKAAISALRGEISTCFALCPSCRAGEPSTIQLRLVSVRLLSDLSSMARRCEKRSPVSENDNCGSRSSENVQAREYKFWMVVRSSGSNFERDCNDASRLEVVALVTRLV